MSTRSTERPRRRGGLWGQGFWGGLASAYYYARCCVPRRGINAEHLLLQLYMFVIGFALVAGAVIIVGGEARFSAVSFSGPRELSSWVLPMAPYITWGVLFGLGGVTLIICIGQMWAFWALSVGAVVNFFFACSFLFSLLTQPTVSGLGVVIFAAFAVLHAILAAHVRVHGWR